MAEKTRSSQKIKLSVGLSRIPLVMPKISGGYHDPGIDIE
jgi:hypothetical protein